MVWSRWEWRRRWPSLRLTPRPPHWRVRGPGPASVTGAIGLRYTAARPTAGGAGGAVAGKPDLHRFRERRRLEQRRRQRHGNPSPTGRRRYRSARSPSILPNRRKLRPRSADEFCERPGWAAHWRDGELKRGQDLDHDRAGRVRGPERPQSQISTRSRTLGRPYISDPRSVEPARLSICHRRPLQPGSGLCEGQKVSSLITMS